MDENRKIKRGEIYWIEPNPYRPSVGSVQMAGRPAIVVSNDDNNLHALTAEIVYLTTAPKIDLPTHCTIRSANKPSIALCEQVTTVSTEQFREYIGTCTQNEMKNVDACMAISLGLDFSTHSIPEKDTQHDVESQKTIDDLKKEKEIYITKLGEMKIELERAKAREELLMQLYTESTRK